MQSGRISSVALSCFYPKASFFFLPPSLLFNPSVFAGRLFSLSGLCLCTTLLPLHHSIFFFFYSRFIHHLFTGEKKKKNNMRARVHLDLLCYAIWYPECQPALGGHLCHSLSQRYRCGALPVAHTHPSTHPSIQTLVEGKSEPVWGRKIAQKRPVPSDWLSLAVT